MLNKELRKKVEERKKEALEKKLFDKTRLICMYFGKERKHYTSDSGESFLDTINLELKTHSIYFSFFTYHFFSEGGEGVKIYEHGDKGKLLFDEYHDPKKIGQPKIDAYVPGEWEQELESLYVKSLKKKTILQKKEKKKENDLDQLKERELKEKFGL